MRLNLRDIIEVPGGSVPFSCELETEGLDFPSIREYLTKPYAEGRVYNEAGILRLEGRLTAALHCVCDRCAGEFDRPFHLDARAVLVQELMNDDNEDEETFCLQGDAADRDEILTTVFVLNMETKFLCSEDCKGLCAVCGKNLNEGPCDCKPEPDPRLAVLAQLLKDK